MIDCVRLSTTIDRVYTTFNKINYFISSALRDALRVR